MSFILALTFTSAFFVAEPTDVCSKAIDQTPSAAQSMVATTECDAEPPVAMTGCTDGDGGNVPGTASYVIDAVSNVFVDRCNTSGTAVNEYICNGSFATSVLDPCANGCVTQTITIPGFPGTWVVAKCR
jgi:hypothetical protein